MPVSFVVIPAERQGQGWVKKSWIDPVLLKLQKDATLVYMKSAVTNKRKAIKRQNMNPLYTALSQTTGNSCRRMSVISISWIFKVRLEAKSQAQLA